MQATANQVKIKQPSPKKPYYFVNRDSFVKEDTDIDVGYYIHKQKLGEGGFSKVRLGTHLLTGEKVAIKCMEKEKLGDDLFRVQTEINALKVLQHENISKLLQVIETDTKIYLILEYCSGGELFDYIVSKSRLSEAESQRIISSLIEVLAFIHSNGFAHRDLKPENILFDSKQRIKLIDFGLAGQAKDNPQLLLKTCCGSPCYASPELLSGSIYSGPLADVWSAGIILYTLLVGRLPFEDDNLTQLYKKIQSGIFHMPSWLSKDAKSMINSMLQVNPKNRSNIQQLLKHPWINAYRSSDYVEVQKGQIDEELLWQVHKYFQTTQYGELRRNILTKFGYQTATYWLLKEKNRNLLSPFKYRNDRINFTSKFNPIEYNNREKARQANEKKQNTPTKTTPKTPVRANVNSPIVKINANKINSPAKINNAVAKVVTTNSPVTKKTLNCNQTPTETSRAVKRKIENEFDTPKIVQKTKILEKFEVKCSSPIRTQNKENNSFDSPSRIPVALKSPIMSPLKVTNQQYTNSPILSKKPRMFSPDSKIPVRFEKIGDEVDTPSKEKLLPTQTPKKSLLKRILATATPGHSSLNTPRTLTTNDSTKNLTMTKYTDPQQCINKLIDGLRIKGVDCKQKGFTIRCAMNNKFANVLTFNLEVVQFMNSIAIQRKRLRGDAWNYKKICEEILRISNESENTKKPLYTDV